MKKTTLSKEKKQQIILIALLGVLAVLAVAKFGVGAFLDSFAKDEARREELRAWLAKAKTTFEREKNDQMALTNAEARLSEALNRQMPKLEAEGTSWIKDFLTERSRELGYPPYDAIRVSKGEQVPLPMAMTGKGGGLHYMPFGAPVQFSASFSQLVDFVGWMQEANPFVHVVSLSIKPDSVNKELHKVDLQLQWPLPVPPPAAPPPAAKKGST